MNIRILLMALILITLKSPASFASDTIAKKNRTNIGIYNTDKIRLDIVADFKRGVNIYQTNRFPKAIKVLTGNFFNKTNLSIASLLIIDGHSHHGPSKKKNRPVIAQEKEELGAAIVITTNINAWENRKRYRVALEAGPFLIVDGKDWNDFNFADRSFYRYTRRVGVGLTYNNQFFFIEGYGTLYQFRYLARERVPKIKYLMNLDGGSSAYAYQLLPTRLVVNLK